PSHVQPLRDGRVDLASIQGGPVAGGAYAASVGLRAGGHGCALRLVVFAPGEAASRVQPEGRMSGAGARSNCSAPDLVVELSKSRQGLRRPDAASDGSGRGDAASAQGAGLGI